LAKPDLALGSENNAMRPVDMLAGRLRRFSRTSQSAIALEVPRACYISRIRGISNRRCAEFGAAACNRSIPIRLHRGVASSEKNGASKALVPAIAVQRDGDLATRHFGAVIGRDR